MKDDATGLDRRGFLRQGTLATLGATTVGLLGASPSPSPSVQGYRPLGRTGLSISDVSFGSSRTRGTPGVIRRAFDRGINYFDTAESYQDGLSEETIGKALHDVRDEVILASKTQCGVSTPRAQLMERLEGSLKRLQTDRIDVYFNHAVNGVKRLQNPEWLEFVELAKKQGKIRFTGMSGHGGRLLQCVHYALDNDLVDVLLLAYNFGQKPGFHERFTKGTDMVATQTGLPQVIKKARAKGVGVVAMKTLMGAKRNDLAPYSWPGASVQQAGLAWALSNPDLSGLIISMTRRAHVDHYLGASGRTSVEKSDVRKLERWIANHGDSYCRPACDTCEASCPAGVPIADVLRARMYAVDYEDPALGHDAYARLGAGASACASCADSPCLGSCPYCLDIPELTRDARRRLG